MSHSDRGPVRLTCREPMDFDPLHLDVVPPKSQSTVDIRAAYSEIVPQALAAIGNLIADDHRYTSNEEGHLAWDVSLLVRAAVLSWRTTGRPEHLAIATNWATRLCAATDEARGTFDWRGRSGPIWSAGSRYTAGTATVGHFRGVEVRLQAAAHQVVIERPSDDTAVIKTFRDGECVWVSPEAALAPGNDDYLPDVLALRSSVRSALVRGLAEPTDLTQLKPGVHQLRPLHASHLVHAGMIARALLEVAAALVDSGTTRPQSQVTPTELETVAARAIAFHDDDLVKQGTHAWYVTPLDFPGRRLGLTLPHNHVSDVISTHLHFASRDREEGRRELARALAQPFFDEIELADSGELSHFWHYYPVGSDSYHGVRRQTPMAERLVRAVTRAEDASHATIRVRALADWKVLETTFVSDRTMQSVGSSFRSTYLCRPKGRLTQRWLPGDGSQAPRQGHTDSYAGAWSNLAPWHPALRRQVNSLAQQNPPRNIFGATALSAAEILAMNWTRPAHPRQLR